MWSDIKIARTGKCILLLSNCFHENLRLTALEKDEHERSLKDANFNVYFELV